MATDEQLVLRGQGSVDVQINGPGHNWIYLSACASMTGPTVPFGDTERRFCQDPKKANGFTTSSEFQTAPDLITFDLVTKLGKVNHLKRLNCPFALRSRYADCGEREDPANYNPIMLAYCRVRLQSKSYDDLVITDPANQDEIMVTSSLSATEEMEIHKVNPARIGTAATLGDQPINDIEFCDSAQCADTCGDESDGCTIAYGVTDNDTAPYAAPNLVKYSKNLETGTVTFSTAPILGLNGDVENIECKGGRLGVTSNGDSAFAYNVDPNYDQDEWNVVTLTRAPSTNHNALFARTTREWWLGCVGGYILKSVDGGATWNESHSATLTTQTINAVWAYNKDLIYAAGNAGVILKSEDGGESWQDYTEVATVAANLLTAVVPPNRPDECYFGTNNGRIYRTTDGGPTLARISFDGDSVGTVDDIDFCGCEGATMWILHNDAGPRARILRDLSGGAGGADVETVMDYTQLFPAGIDLNALTCCDSNEMIAAGELSGGFPVVIKVS